MLETQIDSIIESIFDSYCEYDLKNPNSDFRSWNKNKNPRKKFKTLKLYVEQEGRCYHCSKIMKYDCGIWDDDKTSLDRIIPGAKGGSYRITNLVLSCLACNKQRGDKTITEYNDWKKENT